MLLDKKDLAILRELDKGVRASLTQIGKRTRLGKEVVAYRLKRLQERGILTGYWVVPRISAQTSTYKLLLKNKSLGTKKQALIDHLLAQQEVGWLALTEGTWDIVATLFVTSDADFSLLLKKLFAQWGSHFKEKHILKSTSMITTNEKYLHEQKRLLFTQTTDFLEKSPERDETDKRIVKEISLDGRISFAELGKHVGLTPEAVSYRYRKLVKNKEIALLKPRIDHGKLGLSYYHLFIAMNDFGKLDELDAHYTHHPACVFLMHHVGYYDVHLELVMKEEETQTFIDELTEKFGEAIASYELLKVSKEFVLNMTRT